MIPPWVLIDVSYLAHRAMHSMGNLEFEDFPTGVMYGFFEQLRTICHDRRILSNKVALCVDSRQSYRKRLFPDYKKKREKERSPDEVAQLSVLRVQTDLLVNEVLPAVGFPIYRQTGCESDDVMAKAADHLSCIEGGRVRLGVMVTADGDLYQCISDAVHWYDPARDLYLDPDSFQQRKLIGCNSWCQVKALAGCKSDNVPGIPGVGEATAIKYLLHLIPMKHKILGRMNSPEGKAIYKRNLLLVTLPFIKTKKVKLEVPQYNPDEFFRFCEVFGMKSYLEGPRKREWQAFFSGNMGATVQVPRKRGEARPCKRCGKTSCYHCPECLELITEHKKTCSFAKGK